MTRILKLICCGLLILDIASCTKFTPDNPVDPESKLYQKNTSFSSEQASSSSIENTSPSSSIDSHSSSETDYSSSAIIETSIWLQTITLNTSTESFNTSMGPATFNIDSIEVRKTEVTRLEYESLTETGVIADADSLLPITNISWYDMLNFCNLISQNDALSPAYEILPDSNINYDKTANGWRLPELAEWELMARNGITDTADFTTFVWGELQTQADIFAWHFNNAAGELSPVAQKQSSSLGLYDVAGNAAEWIWTAENGRPMIKGGSVASSLQNISIEYNATRDPDQPRSDLGFRIVKNK
jgi:hypothetical protein